MQAGSSAVPVFLEDRWNDAALGPACVFDSRRTMSDPTFRNSMFAAGITAVAATLLAVVGWRFFEFDRALFVYAQALILSLALTVYRFAVWVHRPPTRVLYRRAFSMLKSPQSRWALKKHLASRVFNYFALNHFVWQRGLNRWSAHWPIMIGCGMALAIVVPLIFGWVWFETPADDLTSYEVMLFGVHVRTISVDSFEAFIAFHGLVWASIPVIIGCCVALRRRMNDRGDQATQTFANDIVPLVLAAGDCHYRPSNDDQLTRSSAALCMRQSR